jgi:hypothetical protein
MNIYSPTIITERMIETFRPSRLAIKELVGVLYFCKSINQDIISYSGSGVVWRDRIKKYGKENIKTLWVSDWYHDPHEIQQIALHFSEENQIVESSLWANQKPENGLDGGTTSEIQNRPERLEKNRKSTTEWWQNASEEEKEKRVTQAKTGMNKPGVSQKKSTSMKKTLSLSENKKRRAEQVGPKAPRYDKTIYTFYNIKTAEMYVGVQYDFKKKYGIHRLSRLSGGWQLVE